MSTKPFLFLAALIFTGISLKAQIIYVDANNLSGIEDGTELHPFNTIKEGIEGAVPGNQVTIRQGTYIPDDSWSGNDHTLLLKAGVRLVGEGPVNTIIQGIVVDQVISNLSIGLENLRFDEFHFVRGSIAGPFLNQNIIRNCSTLLISLPFGAGIPVNDSTPGPNYGFLIEDNTLWPEGIIEFKQGAGVSELRVVNNLCGYIYLKSGAGYTYLIDNNDIQYGIFDRSATNTTTISNNRIFNGIISDISGGNQYGVEDEIIENNTITVAENSPAFADEDDKAGIIAKSRSVTIRNNTITCTGNVSGIHSLAGAPFHATGNTILLDEVQQPIPEPSQGTVGIFNYSGKGSVTGNTIHGGAVGYYSKAGTMVFAGNVIEKAFTGFYSQGAEVVHHNSIKNCYGNGMILDGLKGPLHDNEIKNNAGSGILIIRMPIDLGGGADASPGYNTIQGNGNHDLYIETQSPQYPTLFARYNIWDHSSADEVRQYDIRDGNDSTGLVVVDFLPMGNLGIDEQPNPLYLSCFPNPCSHFTVIIWQSAVSCHVVLSVFDCLGNAIKTMINEVIAPGDHRVTFDATGLPSGVYFCQLQAGRVVETIKMIVY